MRAIIFMILTAFALNSQAQVSFILDTIPDYTPQEDQIYITGNFNGWNAALSQYALSKNDDNLWEIILNGFSEGQSIEYKFTRGSFETGETGEQEEEIPNRVFTFGNGDTVHVTIQNWADKKPDTIAAENVYVVDLAFYMPQLNRSRRICIYLPPEYDTSGLHYPVIYMQDGGTLFEDIPDWNEMEIDETLNNLASQGYNVPIVVGIDNGEWHRANEYLPSYFEPLGAGGEGDEYMQFIVETLKPYIDENYRTLPNRENTGIIGGSFGGLISWFGAIKYQHVFSKCGVFSPAYWANQDSVYHYLAEFGYQHNVRFYQNVGENEDVNQYINFMYQMEDALNSYGFNEVFSKVIPNGYHVYAPDFESMYLWLFQYYATGTEPPSTLIEPPYSMEFDGNVSGIIAANVSGAQTWSLSNYGTPPPCAQMSGYDGTENVENEDWLIFPGFNFSNLTSPILQFNEAINFSDSIETQQTVMISTNYSGSGYPSSAAWIKVDVTNRANGSDWGFVTVSPIDLSEYAGEDSVYIAFKYTSTVNGAAYWQIDNVNVLPGIIPNEPPQISNVTTNPVSPNESDAVNVSAIVTDTDGTISSVILNWGLSSGGLTNQIDMTEGTDNEFITNAPIPPQSAGNTVYYQITATDNDSESAYSQVMSNSITTNITNLFNNGKIILHPNPVKDILYIGFEAKNEFTLSIIDTHGKTIFLEKNYGQNMIDVSDLAEGVYFLNLVGKKETIVERFMKQ